MSEGGVRPPRVVIFRSSPVAADTRARKWAISLGRAGYDVILLDPVEGDGPLPPEGRLGEARVVRFRVGTSHRDRLQAALVARRRRRWTVFTRQLPKQSFARAASLTVLSRRDWAAAQERGLRGAARLRARALARRAHAYDVLARSRAQQALDVRVRNGWKTWTRASRSTAAFATVAGTLPIVLDFQDALLPVLVDLQPDVMHAHHPHVLPAAVAAKARLRARGQEPRLVYDARELFAGIPEGQRGTARHHAVMVRLEADAVGGPDSAVDAVATVSEPIAEELRVRYHRAQRPCVVLNAPVWRPRAAMPDEGPDVRTASGLGDEPLVVYSGGLQRSRGLDDLMQALGQLPGVHLALVTVPFPHPMTPELLEVAGSAAPRVHVLPPVSQERLPGFLATADVAVHPMPGGSPNHDMALPNKLFEYLHAGLPMAVSDARAMAAFVREHDLGEVFRSGDPDDLAAALRRALARHRTEGSDRERLAQQWSWQAQEPQLWAFYRRIAPLPSPQATSARADEFPRLDERPALAGG